MNAISTVTSSTPYSKPASSAPATPSAAPAPAAAITLSAAAQKAISTGQPQPNNIIWGS